MISPDTKQVGLTTPIQALKPVEKWTRDISDRVNMVSPLVGGGGIGVEQIPGVGSLITPPVTFNTQYAILAVIQSSGPGGAANYTDNRYWWKAGLILQNSTDSNNAVSTPAVVVVDDATANGTAQTFTNLYEGASQHSLVPGSSVWVFPLMGRQGTAGTFTYTQWVSITPVVQFTLGRLIGVLSTTNATTWVQNANLISGATVSAYNGMEWNGTNPSMIQGSPGSLGIAVGTDGSVTGTSCFVKPPGITGWIPFVLDTINSRWTFCIANSAGA